MNKVRDDSEGVRMEIDAVQKVVTTAQKNLATLERALATLRQREKKASARLRDLQKRAARDSKPRSGKAYLSAKDGLKSIALARRRNERIVARQRKAVAEQVRRLQGLKRQARAFDRDLTTFHRRAASAAPKAQADAVSGEQVRGARAMLGQSLASFAKTLGISVARLRRFEKIDGLIVDKPETVAKVIRALKSEGVQLIGEGMYVGSGGPGIRLGKRRATRTVARKKTKTRTKQRRPGKRTKAAA